jgi:hypothetical protein
VRVSKEEERGSCECEVAVSLLSFQATGFGAQNYGFCSGYKYILNRGLDRRFELEAQNPITLINKFNHV